MSVSKNPKNGTWTVQCWYRDWKGERHKKTKRGFASKSAATQWERAFTNKNQGSMDMTLEDFVDIYAADMKPNLKRSTWRTKEHLIRTKILPTLGKKKVDEISSADIIRWQNSLIEGHDRHGRPYSKTYLRTIANQLNAILNHAVRHYALASNPMLKVGKMGEKSGGERTVWTKGQYLEFSRTVMDKPTVFVAFEILYWCGLRSGELLALTKDDIDLDKGVIKVTKTYSRVGGEDFITSPKTKKSVRRVVMPDFLIEEIREYLVLPEARDQSGRIFPITKYCLKYELRQGADAAGLPTIRVHDLRHSHVSLLIEMGFSLVAIADRLGHEATEITLQYAHLFPNKQQEIADNLDKLKGATS